MASVVDNTGPTLNLVRTNGTTSFGVSGTNTTIHNVQYTFPQAQGAAQTVLTNNGSGVLGWGTISGVGGPAAITNLFTPSLSNATIKPIVFGGVGTAAGMTNVTGQLYGLEAGTGVTLTPNESNIVVSTTSGGLAFSDSVWTNNGTQILPNAFPTNVLFRVDTPDDGVVQTSISMQQLQG